MHRQFAYISFIGENDLKDVREALSKMMAKITDAERGDERAAATEFIRRLGMTGPDRKVITLEVSGESFEITLRRGDLTSNHPPINDHLTPEMPDNPWYPAG